LKKKKSKSSKKWPKGQLAARGQPCGQPRSRPASAGRKLVACGLAGRKLAASWPLPCGLLPQGLAASELAGRKLAALLAAALRPATSRSGRKLAAACRKLAATCRKAVWPPSAGRWARGYLAAVSGRFWGIRPSCFLFILVHSADATCQHLAPLKITPYKYPATTQ